jgi:DNA-directed RNA polymerase specialized sigma24 family protein
VLRTVPDATADLDALLARREVQVQVRSAIEGLGPEHRDVALLREIEELSYGEIAGVLQIPVGTVRSRLHNARVELGTFLGALARNGRVVTERLRGLAGRLSAWIDGGAGRLDSG